MADDGNWVPGLSDIDLIVTFTTELSREDEFTFLTNFWAKQASLRRVFPMLKDVLLLNDNHLATWTRFRISGFEAPRWKTLSGTRPVCAYNKCPSTDAVDDALYRFSEILLAWYCEPVGYLTFQRMRRLASRILRHAPESLRIRVFRTEDPTILVAQVLLQLDRWIRESELCGTVSNSRTEDAILVRENYCLLVAAKLDLESLRENLLRLRKRAQSGMRVQIATLSVLAYWLRVWKPGLYHDWIADGQSESGPDILSRIEPPDKKTYSQQLLNLTNLILSFPQWEVVISQKHQAWFAGEAFRWMALRGWFLWLYLEKGIQWPLQRHMIDEIHRHYPHQMEELAAIAKLAMAPQGALAELRYRGFCLLKETAVAVSRALKAAPAAHIAYEEVVVGA